eukprot:SAG11_NODE_5946_length_1427_cov_2.307229_2_plen_85_part_00
MSVSATESKGDTDHEADRGSDRVHDDMGRYTSTDPIAIGKLKGEGGFVAVYIDDLIVFSPDAESHKRHLLQLLRILSWVAASIS